MMNKQHTNILHALIVGLAVFVLITFVDWAAGDLSARMDAATDICNEQGGDLVDSSTGYRCVVPYQ